MANITYAAPWATRTKAMLQKPSAKLYSTSVPMTRPQLAAIQGFALAGALVDVGAAYSMTVPDLDSPLTSIIMAVR